MVAEFSAGRATIRPNGPVVAGTYTTIEFTYVAGHPVDSSGYVKITFRSVSDIGTPQFADPAAANFCTVSTTGNCRVEPRWDPKGHTRPWGKALFLKVGGGFLNTGEKISVLFGDTSSGSPGWRMQTSCEDAFEFKSFEDPIATYQFKELPTSPSLAVVPGPPARAICVAPSQVTVGQAFTYRLKLEDAWGNPTELPRSMSHPGFSASGAQTITVLDRETNLSASSNPIDVVADSKTLHPYWADLHGQSGETVGIGTVEGYFAFARDYGLLDVAAHQGNDFQITDALWERINAVTRSSNDPGRFVTFPGYEWSGNTPLGGDRNVYFLSEGGPISRSSTELVPASKTAYENSSTARELFNYLRQLEGLKSFAFAHVGGRYSDLSMHDPEIELAVEIHSSWGSFEWLLEDALARGYRVGICANSDGHKCRPGASYPGAGEFGSLGGLTCILAEKLDRENIFAALSSRHFYATTGNRSLLQVELAAADGRTAIMGDALPVVARGALPLRLQVRVVGTAPVESVEVYNSLELIERRRPYGEADLANRIKVAWSGAEERGRDRMVSWDGGLRVRENQILEATPVNFWNAHRPLEIVGPSQLRWRSVTTGGVSGVVVALQEPWTGMLELETTQRRVECEIGSIGLEPMVYECGGLRKKVEVYRLPESQGSCEFAFELDLASLRPGDNALYVRVMQEDGHLAWSSPIFLTRAAG